MNTLYIIRHAKSSWSGNEADFDRPLNERGEKDAPEMALRLKAKLIVPNLIISSPAKRANRTASIFADILGYDKKSILFEERIYEDYVDTIFNIVRNISPSFTNVFIFGHNPTLTYFVNELTSTRIDNIPTCGIAAISIQDEWKDVRAGTGKLAWFDYPKNMI